MNLRRRQVKAKAVWPMSGPPALPLSQCPFHSHARRSPPTHMKIATGRDRSGGVLVYPPNGDLSIKLQIYT